MLLCGDARGHLGGDRQDVCVIKGTELISGCEHLKTVPNHKIQNVLVTWDRGKRILLSQIGSSTHKKRRLYLLSIILLVCK